MVWFWCSVTLAGVSVTMLAGVPVTVKLTVMSALAESQKAHPGVTVMTKRACGGLAGGREGGRAKQQAGWMKGEGGGATSRARGPLGPPRAGAGVPAAGPQ